MEDTLNKKQEPNRKEDADKILERLADSTRSPRGRFSAEQSWMLLEVRIGKRRKLRRFYLRIAGSAAAVLLCVASWATYHALNVESPAPQPAPTEQHSGLPRLQAVLNFEQRPLQEIAEELSDTFGTPICIIDDSLKNFRMTATFKTGESLDEILNLLQRAAPFELATKEDTIYILKLH
ncbi:MAG: DUF4974 domain-containing protein [Bacteroides sp.]|nr:DUF4974 domain-containing protein [Bacteroides sp.]